MLFLLSRAATCMTGTALVAGGSMRLAPVLTSGFELPPTDIGQELRDAANLFQTPGDLSAAIGDSSKHMRAA